MQGYGGRLYQASWPVWEEAKTVEAVIEVAVQVNGKVRATVKLPADADKDAAIAAGKEEISRGNPQSHPTRSESHIC